MDLLVASTNPHKLDELREILAPGGWHVVSLAEVEGGPFEEPVEDWRTTPIGSVLELSDKQAETLVEAAILNVEQFETLRAGAGITSLSGIGETTAEKWEDQMLDWLAERHGVPACSQAAQQIDASVATALAQRRIQPVDLGGRDSTAAITRSLVNGLVGSESEP